MIIFVLLALPITVFIKRSGRNWHTQLLPKFSHEWMKVTKLLHVNPKLLGQKQTETGETCFRKLIRQFDFENSVNHFRWRGVFRFRALFICLRWSRLGYQRSSFSWATDMQRQIYFFLFIFGIPANELLPEYTILTRKRHAKLIHYTSLLLARRRIAYAMATQIAPLNPAES